MKEIESQYNIAIIIPAYKSEYLPTTLDSLVKQTDKNFKVYIGDDNSPDNLFEIVRRYIDKLNLVYNRFDENLGGKDLVAHWNRCLNMTENEDWFILFSDDDILDPDCIRLLRQEIQSTNYNVHHFNLKIIDADGNLLSTPAAYPKHLPALDFFKLLYTYKIDARMPEFVFRLSHFRKTGGFIPFELAMCSDNATVISCAYEKGINTIGQTYVQWRNSGKNVSAATDSKPVNIKMFRALVSFFNWMNIFCKNKGEKPPLSLHQRMAFLLEQRYYKSKTTGNKESWKIVRSADDIKHNWLLVPYIQWKKRKICRRMRR